MKTLNHIGLGAKLLLAPALAVLLLLLVGGACYLGLSRQHAAIGQIIEQRYPQVLATVRLADQVKLVRGTTYQLLAWKSSEYSPEQCQALQKALGTHLKTLADMTGALSRSPLYDAGEAARAASLPQQVETFSKSIVQALDLSETDPLLATLVMVKLEPNLNKILGDVRELGEAQEAHARADATAAAAAYRMAVWTTVAVVAGGLLLAWGVGALVRRAILGSVGSIRDAAHRLKVGDLSPMHAVAGTDEVARSAQALSDTVQTLRHTLSNVVDVSRHIDQAIHEIAQGNADLSARTEQQASQVQQASANMAELLSTVGDNTRSADDAARLADQSFKAAEEGGQIVDQVVAVMGDITSSARKIHDITSVIDGIAFQTNILALNAAVEAARAGEQGRGFAVVAGEVRTLSQRSATAASEIKRLITDSVARIDAGAHLANDAGQAMRRIVEAAGSLAATVERISLASRSQNEGISVMTEAVSSIDGATQQNSALVEQAAAAAASLRKESERLVSTVSIFKMDLAPAGAR